MMWLPERTYLVDYAPSVYDQYITIAYAPKMNHEFSQVKDYYLGKKSFLFENKFIY